MIARAALAAVLTAVLAATGCGGESPDPADLVRAAETGDVTTVQRLLADLDPDVRDPRGRTPLIAAAEAGRLATARVLLDAGADVNASDDAGDTAYPKAALADAPEVVGLLLDRGADRIGTRAFGGTPLIAASDRGYVEVVRTILARPDIPIDHVNDLGWTALLEAVILGDGGPAHQEIVALLVAAGADVNLADRDGVTPLAHARRRGYDAMVRTLATAGAR